MTHTLISCKPMTARELSPMVRRITQLWRQASPDRRADGVVWYPTAYDIAAELTPADVRVGAGVLAALSPQMSWSENVRAARQTVLARTARGTQVATQVAKADAILAGEDPNIVLRGSKERAFYRCIVDPDNTDTVVVDRHAHDIVAGAPWGNGHDRGLRHPTRYSNIVRAYVRAGELIGITPCQVQATTWLVWRDIHATGWSLSDANILSQA